MFARRGEAPGPRTQAHGGATYWPWTSTAISTGFPPGGGRGVPAGLVREAELHIAARVDHGPAARGPPVAIDLERKPVGSLDGRRLASSVARARDLAIHTWCARDDLASAARALPALDLGGRHPHSDRTRRGTMYPPPRVGSRRRSRRRRPRSPRSAARCRTARGHHGQRHGLALLLALEVQHLAAPAAARDLELVALALVDEAAVELVVDLG